MRRLTILAAGLLFSQAVFAGKLLDYLREYDLNDYSLGVSYSSSQSPYAGARNSRIAYPYLTSFRDSTMTSDWLLLRDGDIGVRWISESGWELGVVGRLETLSLGTNESDQLLGVADRRWTIELGPTIGWRGWPVHVNFKTYAEVTDRHHGNISYLIFSLPLKLDRGFVVPTIELTHQDRDYVDYYYSVSSAEETPTRPTYSGDAATNLAVRLRAGYALSDKWLLSAGVGFENLDSPITDSPIVGRDHIWSANIGLAYNADVFDPREYDGSAPKVPDANIRVSAFRNSISTEVARDTADGVPGFEVDIEDILGVSDEKTTMQIDATIRLAHYHRLEVGYFEIGRQSATILASDLVIGDTTFPAGTSVDTRVNASVLKATYSYSLMRDAQKELAITGGIHFSDFSTTIAADGVNQVERTGVDTPLPVIGVKGSLFLGEKTTIGANIQIFRTRFDNYKGSLNHATLDVQYRVSDAISIGAGYSYYGMKLTSANADVNGYLKVRHHGPLAFVTVGF